VKPLFFAAALLAAAPMLAQAHGPTRQKIAETVEIAAPPAQVWARIGQFHDMSWRPAVAATARASMSPTGSPTRRA